MTSIRKELGMPPFHYTARHSHRVTRVDQTINGESVVTYVEKTVVPKSPTQKLPEPSKAALRGVNFYLELSVEELKFISDALSKDFGDLWKPAQINLMSKIDALIPDE